MAVLIHKITGVFSVNFSGNSIHSASIIDNMMEKEKDKLEIWLGKHNREMELLRTICSFIAAFASTLVLLKVFGWLH